MFDKDFWSVDSVKPKPEKIRTQSKYIDLDGAIADIAKESQENVNKRWATHQHVGPGKVNIFGTSESKDVDRIDVITKDLTLIKDRLLLIEEDFKKHEQYPALKEAYEQYKTIEALLKDHK